MALFLGVMSVQSQASESGNASALPPAQAEVNSIIADSWQDVVAPAAWGGVTWQAAPHYTEERATAAPVSERKGASLEVSPEPGTAALLVLALVAFLLRRSQKA